MLTGTTFISLRTQNTHHLIIVYFFPRRSPASPEVYGSNRNISVKRFREFASKTTNIQHMHHLFCQNSSCEINVNTAFSFFSF